MVKVWDGNTGEKLRVFELVSLFRGRSPNSPNAINSRLAWSPDGKLLAAIASTGIIKVWDVVSGNVLTEIAQGANKNPAILLFDKEGRRLFCALEGSRIINVWDSATGKLLEKMDCENPILMVSPPTVGNVSISSDGTLLAVTVVSNKCGVVIWDLNNYSKTFIQTSRISFHPQLMDGNREIMFEQEGVAVVWDVQTKKQVRALSLKYKYGHFVNNMGEKNLWSSYDRNFTKIFCVF